MLLASQPGGALNLRSGYIHIAIVVVTDRRLGDLENINIAVNRLHETNIYSQVCAIGVNRADYNEVELIYSW